MKLKKGDKISVMVGKDKGRTGTVEKIYSKQNKVLIAGINIYKKHIKKSDKMPQGGVVELPRPINVSKIALICNKCKKQTRLGYKMDGTKKFRICRKCGERI